MIKAIIRYIVYLPFDLLFVLLSYLLAPLLAALSLITGPVLPGILQWFSTLDADLDGGINQKVPGYISGLSGWRLWYQRTRWIWRNPAHGWQSAVLGMSTSGLKVLDKEVENGWQWYVMQNDKGQTFFCFKYDLYLTKAIYIKIYIGWYNVARDGRNHQYEFQVAPKRK